MLQAVAVLAWIMFCGWILVAWCANWALRSAARVPQDQRPRDLVKRSLGAVESVMRLQPHACVVLVFAGVATACCLVLQGSL